MSDYGDEGPYGDHTGYYNAVEPKFPVFKVGAITMRQEPIYLSTFTGRPPDEPSMLGEALNEVFVPLLIQQFPEIVDFWLPPEGCSYRIAVVSMRKAYPGHAKRVMMAVWSYLRQFMYTKFVIVVDDDIDARDWKDVMWAISTRMDPARDITVIENTPIDYLDFASPESGLGSKAGPRRDQQMAPRDQARMGPGDPHGRRGGRAGDRKVAAPRPAGRRPADLETGARGMSGGRGFAPAEFEARLSRAQALMAAHELDGLLLTTAPNVRYFTGFATNFWESPTRPWFVLVPRDGKPIAVIPEIGALGMAGTWLDDIRTWPAPVPEDDGVSLLAATLDELPRRFGRVGCELGREMSLRMPVTDFERLRAALPGRALVDGSPCLWAIRLVKTEGEIARIRTICELTSAAFAALPGQLGAGDSEQSACRKLRIEILNRGGDGSPYLMGASGPGGYGNIIMDPADRAFEAGDVLIIDTGSTFDGYFCDFDRNWGFGAISDAAQRAHETVWQATEAGLAAARPGATAADLFEAMMAVLADGGSRGNNVGRLGHGLGLQLTEPPSNRPGDAAPLMPGMVMTLEPGMEYAPGVMLVHEENIVIREGAPELLTTRAPRERARDQADVVLEGDIDHIALLLEADVEEGRGPLVFR